MKKRSVREKVEDFLAIFRGRWGRYPEPEDEDIEPEENDPQFKLKWSIKISDKDAQGD